LDFATTFLRARLPALRPTPNLVRVRVNFTTAV
jgi:hypothetical protein